MHFPRSIRMNEVFLLFVATWISCTRADCKDTQLNQLCVITSRSNASIHNAYASSLFSQDIVPKSKELLWYFWKGCRQFGCTSYDMPDLYHLDIQLNSQYNGWDVRNALMSGISMALDSEWYIWSQSFGRGGTMRYLTLPNQIRTTAWRKVDTDLFEYMGYIQVEFSSQVTSYPPPQSPEHQRRSACHWQGEQQVIDMGSPTRNDRPIFPGGVMSTNITFNQGLINSNVTDKVIVLRYCGISNDFPIACVQFSSGTRLYPSACIPNATTISKIL